MKNSSTVEEVLGTVAKSALGVATELRDQNDGPEKATIIHEHFDPLLQLLRIWSNSTRRPRENSLEGVLFQIFSTAKTTVKMESVSRKRIVAILHKAARLQMPPQSANRRSACLLFQEIGELSGKEREKIMLK